MVFLEMSDHADPHIGLFDFGVIVGIHSQIEIRFEFQSPTDIELKIEHDFAFACKCKPFEKDARADGQATCDGLIEPEESETRREHVGSQGVAAEGFLQELGPVRVERREPVKMMSVVEQILADVVFQLQGEVRKIRELGRLRLRLTPNRPGRRLRRTAFLLNYVGQLMGHELPTMAGLGRELAGSKNDLLPDGKRPRLNRPRQLGGTCVGMNANAAEVVAKPRRE